MVTGPRSIALPQFFLALDDINGSYSIAHSWVLQNCCDVFAWVIKVSHFCTNFFFRSTTSHLSSSTFPFCWCLRSFCNTIFSLFLRVFQITMLSASNSSVFHLLGFIASCLRQSGLGWYDCSKSSSQTTRLLVMSVTIGYAKLSFKLGAKIDLDQQCGSFLPSSLVISSFFF